MAITTKQLEHIAHLAYLDVEDVARQLQECRAIIEDIQHLQTVDTTHVSPLQHPTSVTQYLRPDSRVIVPNIHDLEQTAPEFVDCVYKVPLIMKGS
ncbi:MAG: aspartyl/glutamyl-tRNA amidotransferase subunit C [Legionellales bacterium]|nr:aspartyl/glutamyl-tRNA amidotransferase subunit C [Legionellales bacterium]